MNYSYLFINSKIICNVRYIISKSCVRSISSSNIVYSRRIKNNDFKFQEKADLFVKYLSVPERELLENALSNNSKKKINSDDVNVNRKILNQVFMFNFFPFVAFGFLDNAFMILAGEYIDMTLGVAFGISTMAAAALGNLISDVAGVGCSSYVESLCCKIGIDPPSLSSEQQILFKTRISVATGRTVGLIIGCLLGMFPLLFYSNKK